MKAEIESGSRCEGRFQAPPSENPNPGGASEKEARPTAGADCGRTQVLLVNLPPWLPFAPPVGLASIAAVARDAGFKTEILDVNVQLHDEIPDLRWLWAMERHSAWLGQEFDRNILPRLQEKLKEAVNTVVECAPGVVGLPVAAPRQRIVQWFCGRLRQQSFAGLIVLGGPTTFIDNERQALLDGVDELADAVVIGEGESSFLELLNAWRDNQDLASVPGVAVRDGEHWVLGEPRAHEDLDNLPTPDYSLFDLDRYTDRTLCIEWGRGCVRRCKFCEVSPDVGCSQEQVSTSHHSRDEGPLRPLWGLQLQPG